MKQNDKFGLSRKTGEIPVTGPFIKWSIVYHLSPGHGSLRGWDVGWIFDQNMFLQAMSVVRVVTETE